MESQSSPRTRHITPTQQVLLSVGLVVAVLVLTAQSCIQDPGAGPIPQPPGNPTPCPVGCPPPVGPPIKMSEIQRKSYSLYYDNRLWQEDPSHSGGDTETLVRTTDYGQVSAQFFGVPVASGTTAQQLLSTWTAQHIDPNKFTALQESGAIPGAEIGFNAGAGDTYAAVADLPNAPNSPLFIEVLASIKGANGIIFAVVSPLDPGNPDPNSPVQVRSGSFDRLINTVVWS